MGGRERRMVFVTVGTTCFDALVKAVDSEEVKEALLHKGYTELLVQMGRGTYIPSKVSSPAIRDKVGVAPIEEKLVQHRLRWFGHVQRRPPGAPVRSGVLKRADNVKRGRGRPNLTWDESVKRDLKEWNISKGLAMDRSAWRQAINVSANSALQVEYFTFSQSITDYIREASLVISHAGSGSIFETLRLGKPLIVVMNEDLMDNHQSELAEELADRKHLLCARPQTLQETVKAMDLNNLLPYMPGDAKQVVTRINKFLGFPDD
ncbi:unnamed protein product [Urochloa decumbens]|uniref:Glycosyl transferase family 28 C-terminal domain-containing protein n=1 Tax=Urochloa decumbens TaxID=240449 RepID=A0ABC9DBM1_9POAL